MSITVTVVTMAQKYKCYSCNEFGFFYRLCCKYVYSTFLRDDCRAMVVSMFLLASANFFDAGL